MESHSWRERDENGEKIYFRASYHASQWTLASMSEEDADWVPRPFLRSDWVTLRDVLWRKYQRKRCPWKFIEKIDKMLEKWPEDQEEQPLPND